jgi:hypothetical protein
MPQLSNLSRPVGAVTVCLCLAAVLGGCAQTGRSTLGGPGDPATSEEEQRTRGSLHPMPPSQNMPGGGEASGGAGADGAKSGSPGQ